MSSDRRIGASRWLVAIAALSALLATNPADAQTRLLPLGDSITHGGQQHASYRYPLWFDLGQASYVVDFVGRESEIFGGDPPNLAWYPDYLTVFDPDHEGYWGFRTDQIAGFIDAAAVAANPDIVMIHLGTNDIGQNGAAGVTAADTNLRFIIDRLRVQNPSVTVLIARVIPIGPGTSYFTNAAQVGPLNAVVDQIAVDLDTAMSPVLVVDQNTGFDLGTMMQSDGLHPNTAGEAFMADQWEATLTTLLSPGNPPPSVTLTAPADGQSFSDPASIVLTADASDLNGSVSEVRFYAGAQLLGSDATAPYSLTWNSAPLGTHVLTAEAEDDQLATTISAAVTIDVVPTGGPISIPIANASFEDPPLADGALASGPGNLGGWIFSASANTFLGIFDPPAGSYPTAGGAGTPTGADGSNVAFLFNDGGPMEFVEATQTLGEVLTAGQVYELRVAIGRFLPDQPYAFSTYAGYTIELLAGSTPIASETDGADPPEGAFTEASASVHANAVDPALLGQPLTIRLGIATNEIDRSTHFDDVRLFRTPAAAVPSASPLAVGILVAGLLVATGRRLRRAVRPSPR